VVVLQVLLLLITGGGQRVVRPAVEGARHQSDDEHLTDHHLLTQHWTTQTHAHITHAKLEIKQTNRHPPDRLTDQLTI